MFSPVMLGSRAAGGPLVTYHPSNWYWFIGADAAHVWSSAKCALVPVTDPDYEAWVSAGGTAPAVATMSVVENTVALNFPPGTPRTYSASKRYNLASGGLTITSISPVPFMTDPVSRNTIDSAYNYAVANPGHIANWKMSDGSFITLTQAQLTAVLQKVATFVQSCFTCESTVATGINNATITTLAQIDTQYAAISNVVA